MNIYCAQLIPLLYPLRKCMEHPNDQVMQAACVRFGVSFIRIVHLAISMYVFSPGGFVLALLLTNS